MQNYAAKVWNHDILFIPDTNKEFLIATAEKYDPGGKRKLHQDCKKGIKSWKHFHIIFFFFYSSRP